MGQERLWTWLSLGFATLAMMTSLFALATDPTYDILSGKKSEVDYLDQTPDEAVLDDMRGLSISSADN
jgi:hypothetical protein|tara:strand:- start:2396 stop:2599 length:204 start_codon:yes stop_codon:yes gene_type:complete